MEQNSIQNSSEEYLTPNEVAKQLKITAEQVRILIRKGLLSAINIGMGFKRPLYRIPDNAIKDFLKQRSTNPRKKRKFKQPGPVQDFFPDLK